MLQRFKKDQGTKLHEAILENEHNSFSKVYRLLQNGANPNARNSKGESALHVALTTNLDLLNAFSIAAEKSPKELKAALAESATHTLITSQVGEILTCSNNGNNFSPEGLKRIVDFALIGVNLDEIKGTNGKSFIDYAIADLKKQPADFTKIDKLSGAPLIDISTQPNPNALELFNDCINNCPTFEFYTKTLPDNVKAVKSLIAAGVINPNKSNNKSNILALHRAVEKGNKDLVQVLVSLPEKVHRNVQGSNGKTALHLALEKGRADIALEILDNGTNKGHEVNVCSQDSLENTGLHYAALLDTSKADVKKAIIELITQGGKDLRSIKNKSGKTAEDLAKTAVKQFISSTYEALEAVKKAIPLRDAKTAQEITNALEKKNIPVNATINTNGETRLFPAVKNLEIEVGEVLIKKGANINARSAYGTSILATAATRYRQLANEPATSLAKQCCETILKFLLNCKDLDAHSIVECNKTTGNSPLHIAALAGNIEIAGKMVELCKKQGLSIDPQAAIEPRNDTPVTTSDSRAVSKNVKEKEYFPTPLMQAIEKLASKEEHSESDLNIIVLLLENGASPSLYTNIGGVKKTAIDRARELLNPELFEKYMSPSPQGARPALLLEGTAPKEIPSVSERTRFFVDGVLAALPPELKSKCNQDLLSKAIEQKLTHSDAIGYVISHQDDASRKLSTRIKLAYNQQKTKDTITPESIERAVTGFVKKRVTESKQEESSPPVATKKKRPGSTDSISKTSKKPVSIDGREIGNWGDLQQAIKERRDASPVTPPKFSDNGRRSMERGNVARPASPFANGEKVVRPASPTGDGVPPSTKKELTKRSSTPPPSSPRTSWKNSQLNNSEPTAVYPKNFSITGRATNFRTQRDELASILFNLNSMITIPKIHSQLAGLNDDLKSAEYDTKESIKNSLSQFLTELQNIANLKEPLSIKENDIIAQIDKQTLRKALEKTPVESSLLGQRITPALGQVKTLGSPVVVQKERSHTIST